jgi:CRISPR-associated endonuclease Cas3-HD
MIIYSFYDPNKKLSERLRDHVITALQTFNTNSKFIKIGQKLNPNFYKILKYAIIFHDFGKVPFNQYYFNPSKELHFNGHEIISCWAANKYLRKIEDREFMAGEDVNILDRQITLLAILLHHHPMNIKDRAEKLKKLPNMQINTQTFQLFYQELDNIIEKILIEENKNTNEIVEEIMSRHGLLQELWKEIWMNSSSKVKKVFLLVMQGLIAADYNSASKERGRGTSEFAKTIQEFLKLYNK